MSDGRGGRCADHGEDRHPTVVRFGQRRNHIERSTTRGGEHRGGTREDPGDAIGHGCRSELVLGDHGTSPAGADGRVEELLDVRAVHAEDRGDPFCVQALDDVVGDPAVPTSTGHRCQRVLRKRPMVRSASAVMVNDGLTNPTAPGTNEPSTT